MAMPPNIAEVFDELSAEVDWLSGGWLCYCQLFAHSDERVDLLNEVANSFFYIVEDVLYRDVQLSLAKLTDPAASGPNQNLSLEQLQRRVEKDNPQLSVPCRMKLNALSQQCVQIRQSRHKRHAHADLQVALKSVALPGVSKKMIDEALGEVQGYLNEVSRHYLGHTAGYEHFMLGGDGNALVAMLKSGMRYEELVESDSVDPGDYLKSRWHAA